jgi:hypothetical protein
MTRQFLLDANGNGYENPDYRPTREDCEFRATVYEREALARSHQPAFQADLREWAAKARRAALAIQSEPTQGDLFA